MSKVSVVVGAQFGSEAKGHVAAHLTKPENNPDHGSVVCVRVAGPNAGHTVIGRGPDGEEGYAWKLRTVPVAAVSNPGADLVIAAGSEIEWSVLMDEVTALNKAGYDVGSRLFIDSQATVLTGDHKAVEAAKDLTAKLGSTAKGIGAARAARLMREAQLVGDIYEASINTGHLLDRALSGKAHVVIEGTQGYGLGLHAGHYPYCTSSDCRAIDFLSMAGISPWRRDVTQFDVWAVARVYPIRVAGNSGPMKGETTWDQLELPLEYTTVTNKVRRVGEWDGDLVKAAVAANGGSPVCSVALMMFDQMFPEFAGRSGSLSLGEIRTLSADAARFVTNVEAEVGAEVLLIGTGPDTICEVVL